MNWSGSGRCVVRLEEHVLVHVREPGILGRLRERAVLHVDLDGRERDAVVLDDDDLETVRQDAPLDDLLQLGSLPVSRRGRQCHSG